VANALRRPFRGGDCPAGAFCRLGVLRGLSRRTLDEPHEPLLAVNHDFASHPAVFEPLVACSHESLGCGPLANSRFHHRPVARHRPHSKLETHITAPTMPFNRWSTCLPLDLRSDNCWTLFVKDSPTKNLTEDAVANLSSQRTHKRHCIQRGSQSPRWSDRNLRSVLRHRQCASGQCTRPMRICRFQCETLPGVPARE
jgi:hypothetical protein